MYADSDDSSSFVTYLWDSQKHYNNMLMMGINQQAWLAEMWAQMNSLLSDLCCELCTFSEQVYSSSCFPWFQRCLASIAGCWAHSHRQRVHCVLFLYSWAQQQPQSLWAPGQRCRPARMMAGAVL